MSEYIEIINTCQNNLKNISVKIKKNEFTAVTGISGSGKSSLVFDVLYGEGQKKFLEINNSNMSYLASTMPKAQVEAIKGLTPVVALEQKRSLNNPRSTVGTMTGISNLLRGLYAKCGTGSCPKCHAILKQLSISKLVSMIMTLPEGYLVELRSPIKKSYNQNNESMIENIKQMMFTNLYAGSKLYSISDLDGIDLEHLLKLSAEILLDKFTVNHDMYKQIIKSVSVMTSAVNNPLIRLIIRNRDNKEDEHTVALYQELGCCNHGYLFLDLQPADFSYNDSKSACSTCLGLGISYKANPQFMVIDPRKGLYQGALHKGIYNMTPESLNGVILYTLSVEYGFDLYQPYEELTKEIQDIIMYGIGNKKIKIQNTPNARRKSPFTGAVMPFKGFVYDLQKFHREQTLRKASGEAVTILSTKQCMTECECPECTGGRLKEQYSAVVAFGKSITEVSEMQFKDLLSFFNKILQREDFHRDIVAIINEICRKLQILCDIGLYYLNINRRCDSISGGEAQRIKLSGQIGSDMTGLVYIMDEPSIGLHAKDIKNLVRMIKKLKDSENTVIVVEHNLDIISSSDNIIEIGPGSGKNGGNVIANGTINEVLSNQNSLIRDYILDKNKIKPGLEKRKDTGEYIRIVGAKQNNLKNISVDIPLHQFVCVTGVSGSGKSTLINEVLVKKLQTIKSKKPVTPGKHESIEGIELIKNIINIDQKEIGTSTISSPATYMNIFDKIRDIFAKLPESVKKGYTPQEFSLTNPNGLRCSNCDGKGILVTHLQYMPDIESICPVCMADYYSSEGLQFRYKDKNIADILKMSIDEAYDFLMDNKYLARKLGFMKELGLGYLSLGQHTSTISGGEAQRMKLAYELSKNKGKENNLYVFDEPSTGLHPADIEKLIYSIDKLVDSGNSVIVIEHDMDIIKSADHIIDLGPDGGTDGGEIIAQGTPHEVSKVETSYTGQCLKEYFL